MKKRVLSLLLVAAMASSLAACGGTKKNKGEVNMSTDQKEFTIIGGQSALSPGYDSNETLNALAKEAGISIEWDTISDSLAEQVNVHIAGGDLPDAFMGVGFNNYDLSTYGSDGTFIDLTPYITKDIMPNLSAILEAHPEIKSAITMDDGGIYGLPAGEQMGTAGIGEEIDYSIYSVPQFSMINKAWLDDLGLPIPTSLDELHDALVAFQKNDMAAKHYGAAAGSTIPMSTGFDQWCWGQNIFYAGFGFTNWPNDIIADLILQPDKKVDFICDNDAYRDAVTYFSGWYQEGLMDVEMFSQGTTQLMAKCQQGYVGVSTWWYIDELMGDYKDDYVYLPVLTGPKGTKYEGTQNVTVRTGGGINSGNLSITEACESPINLLKFFDQWYTGETVMQLQYGPIGVYFTDQDENGVWNSITEEEAKEKFGKGAGELKSYYEVYGPKLILSNYYNDNFHMEDRAVERLDELYNIWMPQVADATTYPVDCVYTADELETIDRYKSDFEQAISEQEGLWIKNGGPSDEEWEEYKEKLTKNCGLEKLLEVYQNAYDRYAK